MKKLVRLRSSIIQIFIGLRQFSHLSCPASASPQHTDFHFLSSRAKQSGAWRSQNS
ncbi:hypothetical protein KGV55_01830 [Candidatus Gracilibacteria bacterium]|nr:hypothetical protein [Candidatus Gracilibacteria bacterium]